MLNLFKIRALLKKDVRPISIIRLFIIANMGLFAIFAIIWLRPTVASWNNAREIMNRQRQTYAAYLVQAGQYPALYEIQPIHRILPYAYLAAAMDEVQNIARRYGLETNQFRASEPVNFDSGNGERFVEIRVIAYFTGPDNKKAEFTYGLAESAAFIRNLRVDILEYGMVDLRVEFSLFGRGE